LGEEKLKQLFFLILYSSYIDNKKNFEEEHFLFLLTQPSPAGEGFKVIPVNTTLMTT